jgi:nickel transport protein
MQMKWFIPVFTLFVSLLLAPSPAMAHSVQTDYWMKSGMMEIQSTYSTGESLEGAPVAIYAPNNFTLPWKETTTDKEGKFEFNPDPSIPGNWTIKIGEGDHGDILTIPVGPQGVQIDAVSQNPYQAPHSHYIARQVMIGATALSGGLGTWLFQRFKKQSSI